MYNLSTSDSQQSSWYLLADIFQRANIAIHNMQTNNKRHLKVFLSYAHVDYENVLRVYRRLNKEDMDVWFDKEKLLPGQDWGLEITEAVFEADVVIVFLSRHFNEEGFRQREVRLALDKAQEKPEGSVYIIPAQLEECEIPIRLRKWHCVNLFEIDGYRKLIRALRFQANEIGATPPNEENPPLLRQESNPPKKKPSETTALQIKSPMPSSVEETHAPRRPWKPALILLLTGLVLVLILNYQKIQIWWAVQYGQPVYVLDMVLPTGHTAPDAGGNSEFNRWEIPWYKRYLLGMLTTLPTLAWTSEQATRISIRAIDLDAPVVQGDGWENLKKGVGQRIGSVNPGNNGNVVLSAFNDIYGGLFRDLELLKKGDEIILYTQAGAYSYLVSSGREAKSTEIEVMDSTPLPVLTLITTYPYRVDTKRYVVKAELQRFRSLPELKEIRFGIVAGHSGADSGEVCVDPNGKITMTEADVNLKIASLVQQKLLALGFNVDLLREFDPRLQNYKAAALVSIHSDSCDYINNQATGFKVMPSRRNMQSDSYLADCLVNRYKAATGLPFHQGSVTADMKDYHSFAEVDQSTTVAIIDAGYLYLDGGLLVEETDRVAEGIVNGILCTGFADK